MLGLSVALLPLASSWGQVGGTGSGLRHSHPSRIIADLACLPTAAEDEIWVICSRGTCPGCASVAALDCARFVGGELASIPVTELIAAHGLQPHKKTVMYVHGNRTNFAWSLARGLQVFDRLFEDDCPRAPIRFVIWSWPAEPQVRRLREYADNSWRSIGEGKLLANFWKGLDASQSVGVIGYSLGAQAVVSGLEHAAEPALSTQARFEVVAIAPALQRPWFCAENPFAAAGDLPNQITRLENSRDRALRFHRIAVQHLPSGCSTVGIVPGESAQEFATLDVGDEVGRQHNILRYLQPESVRALVRGAVLGETSATELSSSSMNERR